MRPQTRRAGLDEVWAERTIAAREDSVLVTPAEVGMARKIRQENRGGDSGGYVRLLTSDVRSEAALSRRRGGRLIMRFRPTDSARARPPGQPAAPCSCSSTTCAQGGGDAVGRSRQIRLSILKMRGVRGKWKDGFARKGVWRACCACAPRASAARRSLGPRMKRSASKGECPPSVYPLTVRLAGQPSRLAHHCNLWDVT